MSNVTNSAFKDTTCFRLNIIIIAKVVMDKIHQNSNFDWNLKKKSVLTTRWSKVRNSAFQTLFLLFWKKNLNEELHKKISITFAVLTICFTNSVIPLAEALLINVLFWNFDLYPNATKNWLKIGFASSIFFLLFSSLFFFNSGEKQEKNIHFFVNLQTEKYPDPLG